MALLGGATAALGDSGAQAGWHPQLTPLGRATPAPTAPDLAPAGQSPWVALNHKAPFFPGTMLLANNGTVYVHSEPASGGTADWWKLTPDAKGSYVNGTWTELPPMPGGYDPLYFSSAILPNGKMIVEGGEYLGGNPVWTNRGAIYNPVNNSWKKVAPPAGWTNIGDAQADVLANGTYMQAQACSECTSSTPLSSTAFALFNTTGNTWLTPPAVVGKNDPNDEEGWTLMPSGQLLTVDTWLTPTTELFTPSTLSWSSAGNTPRSPVNTPSAEIGPQSGMPGGNVFVVGAGTGPEAPAACTTSTPAATALYDDAQGQWVSSPAIPTINGEQYDSADGPAATLPDGNVLFDVSPCVYNAPIAFEVYDAATNTISEVPNVPNAANDSTYYTRLVDLPNGQVLFNDGSHHLEVYTAGGNADPSWAPSISSISSTNLTPGQTASLSGSQLSGLDQGAAYGDDVQDATNFPVVRITNSASGAVSYARTSDWSSVSVAPGAGSSTNFTVRRATPAGASTLQVIANGIASSPVPVTIK
ncbi:MAG TPA: hypothetical protein VGL69_05055 [Solirubrobacteraceae bacterium]